MDSFYAKQKINLIYVNIKIQIIKDDRPVVTSKWFKKKYCDNLEFCSFVCFCLHFTSHLHCDGYFSSFTGGGRPWCLSVHYFRQEQLNFVKIISNKNARSKLTVKSSTCDGWKLEPSPWPKVRGPEFPLLPYTVMVTWAWVPADGKAFVTVVTLHLPSGKQNIIIKLIYDINKIVSKKVKMFRKHYL